MAARFWVGGTGTWSASNTTNWAATSNGAGGQSVPGVADTVTFDASSGTSFTVTVESGYNPSVTSVTGGTATVTLDLNSQTLTCQTFNFTGSTTRRVAFGSTGQIIITGNNALVFSCQIDTGLTFTGSRNVYFTYTGSVGTRNIRNCTLANIANCYLNMYFTGGSDILNITGSSGLVAGNVDYGSYSGSWNAFGYFYGSLTLSPNMTIGPTASPASFLNPNGVTHTITTNGKTVDSPITVNCPTSTVVFADDLTLAATRTLTLTAGTLNLNNRTANVDSFTTSGSTARTLAFGTSSVFNLTGTNGATAVWNVLAATNWTVTGNAVVNCTYSGAALNRTISAGSVTEANSISFNITAGTDTVTLGGTVRDLNFTGFTGIMGGSGRSIFGNLTLVSGMTVAASATSTTFAATTTGTRTITTAGLVFPQSIRFTNVGGSGGTWQLQDDFNQNNGSLVSTMFLDSGNVDLNNKTLTVGLVSTNNASVRRILFGTTGAINVYGSGTTVWSASNATNFSYTGTGRVNFTYAGATGTRTINHGSTSGGSTTTKAPPMYITVGTDTFTNGAGSWFSDLDFTGFTGTMTNTTKTLTGNLTLGTGMTATGGTEVVTFAGDSGTQTIISNGVTLDFPVTVFTTGSSLQLSEPLTLINDRVLTVNGGGLVANGHDITVGQLLASNSNIRTIDITGITVTLTGTGTMWNTTSTTNLTLIATNSTINPTSTSTALRVFAGGGLTYNDLDIGGATGSGDFYFTGNNTFTGTISSSKTVGYVMVFASGSTTTVGGFTVSGSAGNEVNITSSLSGQHNLVLTGGGTVDVSYTDISNSNAAPADTWYAWLYNNNIDGGNNTGWIFANAVPTSSNFFLVF
jgi:hypothetical protein